MADIALGSVGKIVEIALKVKEAVEMVKQNEKECRDIHRCVARVSALLKRLDETTEMMKDEAMRDTLEDLAESLEHALELVMECQRRHIFRRFLGAGGMAKELERVQNDIVRKLLLGNFATNVLQTTVMVTNIQSAGAAPPPPPPPPQHEVIDGFTVFSLSELMDATKGFSDDNIIGRGGYATVYKGVLQDGGQPVAIKKVDTSFLLDFERLYNEIIIVSELKHKNIIIFLGYCHEIKVELVKLEGKYVRGENNDFCLIEEYMPNGSLDKIIDGSRLIHWSCRFKMIQGIAQGLHYLHEQRVVHLDLNPRNILLDSNMNPRISDFAISEKLDHGDDEIRIDNTLVGTVGYMPPEYLSNGTVSTKCDVYAFGVTLLETIGTMCISKLPDTKTFVEWAWEVRDCLQMELFNPSLCDESHLVQIRRCMEIGLLCIQYDRKDRPAMVDVLAMLDGDEELPALKLPFGANTSVE